MVYLVLLKVYVLEDLGYLELFVWVGVSQVGLDELSDFHELLWCQIYELAKNLVNSKNDEK